MSIRAVVFDFGNVLAFFSQRRAAEQLAAHAGDPLVADDILRFLADTELEPTFEVGGLTPDYVLGRLRLEFGLDGPDEALALAYADMFTANEEVCRLVPRLQGRYRLVLLSNTNDLHYRHFRLEFAEVLDRFDHLVASHQVGYRKPDPRLFAHVGRLTGCAPGECVFIDDLPANVEAARACGWHGVVYRPGDDLEAALGRFGVRVPA